MLRAWIGCRVLLLVLFDIALDIDDTRMAIVVFSLVVHIDFCGLMVIRDGSHRHIMGQVLVHRVYPLGGTLDDRISDRLLHEVDLRLSDQFHVCVGKRYQ